jgi:ABC-type microcin C transport system duplicated ATPase subunit YejF
VSAPADPGTRAPPGGDAAPPPLLHVHDLAVDYGRFRAVEGVGFEVRPGETVALVGESGSGKTSVGRAVLGLVPAAEGEVVFHGTPLPSLRGPARAAFRRRVQAVFQDPTSSLDPRWRVGAIVSEGLAVHGLAPRAERPERARALLARVGLDPDIATRYPHELSGGQRQRVGIARALAVEPSLIVCDECVSALDVSVQAQILNLLKDLQEERRIGYLFIAHDLAVVRHLAHWVLVLSEGRVVESGAAAEVLGSPSHPYTRRLLDAEPSLRRGRIGSIILSESR